MWHTQEIQLVGYHIKLFALLVTNFVKLERLLKSRAVWNKGTFSGAVSLWTDG